MTTITSESWEEEFNETFNDLYWAEVRVEAEFGDTNLRLLKTFIRDQIKAAEKRTEEKIGLYIQSELQEQIKRRFKAGHFSTESMIALTAFSMDILASLQNKSEEPKQ